MHNLNYPVWVRFKFLTSFIGVEASAGFWAEFPANPKGGFAEPKAPCGQPRLQNDSSQIYPLCFMSTKNETHLRFIAGRSLSSLLDNLQIGLDECANTLDFGLNEG